MDFFYGKSLTQQSIMSTFNENAASQSATPAQSPMSNFYTVEKVKSKALEWKKGKADWRRIALVYEITQTRVRSDVSRDEIKKALEECKISSDRITDFLLQSDAKMTLERQLWEKDKIEKEKD
jgi:hypothetical protein